MPRTNGGSSARTDRRSGARRRDSTSAAACGSTRRPSGSLGIVVGLWERAIDHVRAYANVRDTFKPAAFDFSLAENEGVLDPETSRSYDGGLKLRAMEGRIDFEASA